MSTSKPSYDDMSQDDLLKVAEERGVPNREHFRKTEFQKLFKAMDAADQAAIDDVSRIAKERGEKVKQKAKQAEAGATASRIMDMAKANAGVPMAGKPTADRNKVQTGASRNQEAEIKRITDERAEEATRPERLDFATGGKSLIEKIRDRAKQLSENISRPTDVVRSRVADALFMAGKGNTAHHEPLKVDSFEVLEDSTYFSAHGSYKLKKGSVVSAATHDMRMIRKQNVKLQQIDPTKSKILYSELGHPVGLETQPMAEEPQAEVHPK